MSGYSFVGSDIGGFIDRPTDQLFVRWYQVATFHVFYRGHSSGDHGDQEPWSFGKETLNLVRKSIELRYKLLPYFYTSFYQHVNDGTPIIRPIAAVDQEDPETLNRTDECLHGDHILFCPILEENAVGRYLYLPKGKWYNYWTNEVFEGRKEYFVEYSLETSPIFILGGSVIPMYPVQQYVGEKIIKEMDLHVYYYEGSRESLIYEDEGDGYNYQNGVSNKKTFIVKGSASSIEICQSIDGNYNPTYNNYIMHFHGIPSIPVSIYLEDKQIHINGIDLIRNTLSFSVLAIFSKITLSF